MRMPPNLCHCCTRASFPRSNVEDRQNRRGDWTVFLEAKRSNFALYSLGLNLYLKSKFASRFNWPWTWLALNDRNLFCAQSRTQLANLHLGREHISSWQFRYEITDVLSILTNTWQLRSLEENGLSPERAIITRQLMCQLSWLAFHRGICLDYLATTDCTWRKALGQNRVYIVTKSDSTLRVCGESVSRDLLSMTVDSQLKWPHRVQAQQNHWGQCCHKT